jgi:hypothetical protein
MNAYGGLKKIGANPLDERRSSTPRVLREPSPVESRRQANARFRAVWFVGNVLLILAILLAAYSSVWEYSTRKYLKGFSDAVVPVSASPEEKSEAILNWMSTGPARRAVGPDLSSPDRDPIDTLNYTSLLRVCGTATNAFINLADSAGLASRRLLLLNSQQMAKHVVAEILIDRRWIVVDPAFRTMYRGADGTLLTKEQLRDPQIFSAAIRNIRGYSADYTFENTAHVRVIRLGLVGSPVRSILNRLVPGWEDSTGMSLLMERESLATLVAALALIFLLELTRVGLRWYGEKRLGVRAVRVRERIRRVFRALFDTAD